MKDGISDFVFVNKAVEFVYFVCPQEIFNSIFKDEEEIIQPPKKEELNSDAYKGDFILEFARILLNRK